MNYVTNGEKLSAYVGGSAELKRAHLVHRFLCGKLRIWTPLVPSKRGGSFYGLTVNFSHRRVLFANGPACVRGRGWKN